jgi:hypothetical protein
MQLKSGKDSKLNGLLSKNRNCTLYEDLKLTDYNSHYSIALFPDLKERLLIILHLTRSHDHVSSYLQKLVKSPNKSVIRERRPTVHCLVKASNKPVSV